MHFPAQFLDESEGSGMGYSALDAHGFGEDLPELFVVFLAGVELDLKGVDFH